MAFALFYNMADLTDMATAFNDTGISGKDRNDGRIFWNNGLSGWASAPIAPSQHPDAATDPDMRIIIVSNTTLAAFRAYLALLASKYPGCLFLDALHKDLGYHTGAVEPWPWVGPPADPWEANR